MHLGQFLVGERRTKVGIARPQELHDLGLDLGRELMMAGASAFLGDERFRPVAFESFEQALDLAYAQAELGSGLALFEVLFFQLLENLDSTELLIAQRENVVHSLRPPLWIWSPFL